MWNNQKHFFMKNLYHYTSVETLYNMLEKSIVVDWDTQEHIQYLKMRSTHIEYLNDETERKIFIDTLKRKVHECAYVHKTSLVKEQIEKLEKLCRFNTYIISLSALKDDLNMWRGYGGNGVGVNLEFDFMKIARFYETVKSSYKMEFQYQPLKCNYIQPEKCEVEDALVRRIYNYLFNKEDDNEKFEDIILNKAIQDVAILFKHSAYESEEEWRFICSSTHIPNHIISNGIIKPYIEFEIPLDAITSITIGPCIKDDYKIKSIVEFVNKKFIFRKDKIEVKFSNIPYRY